MDLAGELACAILLAAFAEYGVTPEAFEAATRVVARSTAFEPDPPLPLSDDDSEPEADAARRRSAFTP